MKGRARGHSGGFSKNINVCSVLQPTESPEVHREWLQWGLGSALKMEYNEGKNLRPYKS